MDPRRRVVAVALGFGESVAVVIDCQTVHRAVAVVVEFVAEILVGARVDPVAEVVAVLAAVLARTVPVQVNAGDGAVAVVAVIARVIGKGGILVPVSVSVRVEHALPIYRLGDGAGVD